MENVDRTIPLTGNPELDSLLDNASPETLAASLLCVIATMRSLSLADKLSDSLVARVQAYIDGLDGPERKDGLPGPIESWLKCQLE